MVIILLQERSIIMQKPSDASLLRFSICLLVILKTIGFRVSMAQCMILIIFCELNKYKAWQNYNQASDVSPGRLIRK